jgi:hypothetical protein
MFSVALATNRAGSADAVVPGRVYNGPVTFMKWAGVGLLSVAGLTLLPLYAYVASEPKLPGQSDPAWLTPAWILWFAAGIAGTLLVVRGDRRHR